MTVTGASGGAGGSHFCLSLLCSGWGRVLLLGGAGHLEGGGGPASPACARPTRASVVIWNVRSQGHILLIRQTQTGNLYKHKRIHFQKNKLLKGEEERVHFCFSQ